MINFFARHPTAANLLMIAMLAVGLLSLGRLRRETFPDALPVEVEVSVLYPGATPEEVDEAIVQRLDDALESVQHLKEIRSVSQSDVGSVTLRMTDNGAYEAFRNEIENAVGSIADFPDDAEPPVIRKLNSRDPVLDILVESDMGPRELRTYCEQLKDRLLQSKSISEVGISGFAGRVMRVEVSREALLSHGLSPTSVAASISNQNLNLPAGKIDGQETTQIRLQDEKQTADDLEQLIVLGARGNAEVKIGDVGRVVDEFLNEEESISASGKRSAMLQVRKAKSEDALTVAAETKNLIEEEMTAHPDVKLTVINDTSTLVQERISLLVKNGVQGCILVFFVMWLFFNARLSFWVVFSLPVSFLAAFALVPSFGLSINMLTMVGLLMAIGVLMDDGIVIAENIARRRQEGEPAMIAAVNGVKEVADGVLSSFLTTCCVLGPLIFLNGELGRILRVLPMILLLVLGMSLIEAYLILPAHLGHSLSHQVDQTRGKLRNGIDSMIDRLRDKIASVVEWTIRWRYATAGITSMIFLLTIGLLLGGVVRSQVFPPLEGDTIVASLLMQPGTPLERTKQVVEELEAGLAATNAHFRPDQPDGRDLVKTTFVEFNRNVDAREKGPHVATIKADLLANDLRVGKIVDILNRWREQVGVIPDAQSLTFDEPQMGPSGRPIEIELSGLPLEELDQLSEVIQEHLHTFTGVYNITDDTRRGEREILVKLRPGAVGLGVSAFDLGRQLRGAFQGLLSDQIQIAGEGYDVEVRFAQSDRSNLSDLEDFRVSLPSSKSVPLSDVATLTWDRGWSSIGRVNGTTVIKVLGNVDSTRTNTLAVLRELTSEKLNPLKQEHPGLQIVLRGEAEKGAETGTSLGKAAVIGCLGVFIILSFQFRSYVEPMVVMVAIPFAFVGVVWGHYLFNMSLSLPSIMGYASLAGIVVNDSILLMLFLKSKMAEGIRVETAAQEAVRMRFRAVMITSLTTIAGLMPLLFEKSLQAQLLIPIAISICFGLMASTLLVLLVLPSLYVILSDMRLTNQS
jgi:hydrophobic/amphiphilic exporter-1 (mainly G- bacteria), HAE1 family